MPTPVYETGGAAVAGNFLYVPGGFLVDGTENTSMQYYNINTGVWVEDSTPFPLTPTGLVDSASCVAPNGRIYVVNGGSGGLLVSAMQIYNPTTHTWTFGPQPNRAGDVLFTQDSGCAWIGGKMYLWGGYGLFNSETAGTIQKVTLVFDPNTNTWADTGKLMVKGGLWSGYANSTTTAYNAGGTTNLTTLLPGVAAERFTPAGGWVALPNLPTGLVGLGVAFVANKLIAFGGGTTVNFTPQNKTYLAGAASWSNTGINMIRPLEFFASGYSASKVVVAGGVDDAFLYSDVEAIP
jgi:hypothetical protein